MIMIHSMIVCVPEPRSPGNRGFGDDFERAWEAKAEENRRAFAAGTGKQRKPSFQVALRAGEPGFFQLISAPSGLRPGNRNHPGMPSGQRRYAGPGPGFPGSGKQRPTFVRVDRPCVA